MLMFDNLRAGHVKLIKLFVFILIVQVGHGQQICRNEIVESMPDGLQLNDPSDHFHTVPTHESLIKMIDGSKRSLRIASFYVYLTADEKFQNHPAAKPGQLLMDALERAAARKVSLEIVIDGSSRSMNNEQDLEKLAKIATLKRLNMTRLLGAGILHSKFLISDNETFYVGSSNFDWRSYSQIKEIGIGFYQCPILAKDLDKLFKTYMLMADASLVPSSFPSELKTDINLEHPVQVTMAEQEVSLFLAGSPPAFNGEHDWTGRTDDIDALLHVINEAKHRVSVSVMNYSPRLEFGWPKKYWPLIDDALRRAATERNVRVELLFTDWSKPMELLFYKSLNVLQSEKLLRHGGIRVKLLKVPSFDDYQRSIPYARVKHDKYLVTDNGLYIGTSNWAPDYFINTCGVSVVIRRANSSAPELATMASASATVIQNMQDLFDRDFKSQYSYDLEL